MKKISTKIMLGICLSSVLVSLIIGGISLNRSSQVLKKEAEDKLLMLSSSTANNLNRTISGIENSVNGILVTAVASQELDKANQDPAYWEEYIKAIDPIVKKFGESTEAIMGVYFFADPKLTNGLHY